jgi:hypothetical protein
MLLAALLSMASLATAHPGHGSTVVMGTLLSVSPTVVTIEVRDVSTGAVRRERVIVSPDTRYRDGKTPVGDPSAYVGGRAVATVDYEEAVDGGTVYRASEIRLTPAKRKR